MRVGILLPYRDDDDTQMGLDVATVLEKLGADVQIGTFLHKLHQVHPDWDHRCKLVSFDKSDKWYDKDVIVCTHQHPVLNHKFNNKSNKTLIIRLLQCDALGEFVRKGYKANADWFICPSDAFTTFLVKNLRIKNTIHFPWSVNLPPTSRSNYRYEPVSMLLPLHGDNARRADPTILQPLTHILNQLEHVNLSISYSKTSVSWARRIFETLAKRQPDRIKLYYRNNWNDRLFMYAEQSITVLPYVIDGAGIVALQSTAMGTPVIAFNAAPNNEVIFPGTNGDLVPCKRKHDKSGFPIVVAEYNQLEKAIHTMLVQPIVRTAISQTCCALITERQRLFEDSWRKLLDL